MEKTFYSAYDITAMTGMCYNKTLDFIKYSGIHYVRIGRSYLIDKKTFHDFIKNHTEINSKLIVSEKDLIKI